MLLGGTVEGSFTGPEEWEKLLVRSRFRAVTAPFNMYTPRKETEAFCAACERHGVVIAEIGVWKNCFDPASLMLRVRRIVWAVKCRIWGRKQNSSGQVTRIWGRTLPCAFPPRIMEYSRSQ